MDFPGHISSLGDLPNTLFLIEITSSVLMPQSQLTVSLSNDSFVLRLPELVEGNIIAVVSPYNANCINKIGCAGVIKDIQLDNDEVRLSVNGICRFEIIEKLDNKNKFLPKVKVSYDRFKNDLESNTDIANRDKLLSAIDNYFKKFSIDRDWNLIKDTPSNVLVSAITMAFPFHPIEKQALLETANIEEQSKMIIKIIEMESYNKSLEPIRTIN